MFRVLLNWVFPFQLWKTFGADIKNMGVWSIVLYQDLSISGCPQRHPKGKKLGFHSIDNMKQSAIVGMTETPLDVTFVAPYQLMNGTATIMTWWLPGLSFSVNTVLSAPHHQVCNKTDNKLSTLGSVSIVNVYIHNGTGINEMWLVSAVWTSCIVQPYRICGISCLKMSLSVWFGAAIGCVWRLLRPAADPTSLVV